VEPPLYRIVEVVGFASTARMAADASDRELQPGWVLGAGDRITVPNALNIGAQSRLRVQKIADGSLYDLVGSFVLDPEGNIAFPAIVDIGPEYVRVISGREILTTAGASANARSAQVGSPAVLTPYARVEGTGGVTTVDHFPRRGVTTVATSSWRASVTPSNRCLRGGRLVPGRQAQVTANSIGQPFRLVPGGDPAAVDLASIIPSPRVVRAGPATVTAPSTISLASLRSSKCGSSAPGRRASS
jgi:hypothetical protein